MDSEVLSISYICEKVENEVDPSMHLDVTNVFMENKQFENTNMCVDSWKKDELDVNECVMSDYIGNFNSDTLFDDTKTEEWVPINGWVAEFLDSSRDMQTETMESSEFSWDLNNVQVDLMVSDLMQAHRVIESGIPNVFGIREKVRSNWNVELFRSLIADYEDKQVVEFLKFGFPMSREDGFPDPTPNVHNHKGATEFPGSVDSYLQKEIQLGATLGPFDIPPFMNRIGISPISTQEKRTKHERRIILDLSFPNGTSVNDGIDKNYYCGELVNLKYPTVDTLAERIVALRKQDPSGTILLWKRDMSRSFRQLPLCPRDISLIGMRWRNKLFFDRCMPMGLRSAALACQRVTSAVSYIHRNMGHWSINYLDDFASAEWKQLAQQSYQSFGSMFEAIGGQEAGDKACPPNTVMEFLGTWFDTVRMTISVTENRMEELKEMLKGWLCKQRYNKKQLQQLIGKLQFITNCVRPGHLFICRLLNKLRELSDDRWYQTDMEMRKDIEWWGQVLAHIQWYIHDVAGRMERGQTFRAN